jgi:hypothetical protein
VCSFVRFASIRLHIISLPSAPSSHRVISLSVSVVHARWLLCDRDRIDACDRHAIVATRDCLRAQATRSESLCSSSPRRDLVARRVRHDRCGEEAANVLCSAAEMAREYVQRAFCTIGTHWTRAIRRREMKRIGLAVLWVGVMSLAACGGRTPSAPSGDGGSKPAVSGGATTSPISPLDDDSSSYLTASLSLSPTTIQQGQSATLTWSTNNAEHVYLNGSEVYRNGSKTVSPSSTTTYTLVATHDDHRASDTETLTVTSSSGGGGDDGTLRASLTASPDTIQLGQSSTLTWTTSGAEHVYLNGVEVSQSGSRTVSPSSTRTYALLAVHDANRVSDTATVTVSGTTPPPPPVVSPPTASLTPASTTINAGQSATLTWSTTNATSVTMNGSPVALNGSQAYSPTATTTYTLVATNSAGSATATANVTVTAAPPPPAQMPTASLSANPTSIQTGQSTTLTWSTTNATSVTMNGSPVALNGSQAYSPTATTTYTLVATNSAGSANATATVTVTAPPPPPPPPPPPAPTALLTAMPTSIQSGQSSTLQWSTSNAATVTLNGGSVAANGSRMVSPTTTTTYTLVATNASGSVTSTATVTVTAPPPPPPPGLTYVNDTKPIFDSRCLFCHSGPTPTAGLDLSTYAGVMTVVTPGDPNSRLIQMTQPGGPMNGYLLSGQADIIRQWIVNYNAAQQ